MATLFRSKPDLDDGIREEIEVLLEEHRQLIQAAGGQTMCETMAFPTAKSYLSRAKDVLANPFQPRRPDEEASKPQSLSLVATFDTELCSGSDEEDHDHDDYEVIACEGGNVDKLLVLHSNDFSRMSVPDIATIMEKQEHKREQVKQAEVRREQEEIDKGLAYLHEDSKMNPENKSEIQDNSFEQLQMQAEHHEIVSAIAADILQQDSSTATKNIPIVDKAHGKTVVSKKRFVTKVRTRPPRTKRKSKFRFIRFRKKFFSSTPLRVEEKPDIASNDDTVDVVVVIATEAESPSYTVQKIVRCSEQKGHVEKTEKALSSIPVEAKSTEVTIRGEVNEDDKIMVAATPAAPERIEKESYAVYDDVKQEVEETQEMLMALPESIDLCRDVIMDNEDVPETLFIMPLEGSDPDIVSEEKVIAETSDGDSERHKRTLLVVMMCVVFGIGTMGIWMGLARDPIPVQVPADLKEGGLSKSATSKRTRQREIDIEDILFSTFL